MKLFNKIFLLFCFVCSVFIISCESTNVQMENFEYEGYSESDAIKEELKRFERYKEEDLVKAFWYGDILIKKYTTNAEICNEIEKLNSDLELEFKKSIDDENYSNALRIYNSLNIYGKANLISDKNEIERLRNKYYVSVPGLDEKSDENGKKVSDFIKGTVTVIVDKGIKIERGMGMSDAVLGSGFFISRNGYIITNHHVIEDCVNPKYEGTSKLYIKLAEDSETRIPAKVIGYDSVLDLALLKTEVDAPYYFTLGSSNELDIGDSVYVIGSPLGLERTLTSGIISAVDRQLMTLGHVFQIDAAVNSGNSGGPMIDKLGKVQAVVFAGVQNYQGLNFAIPVEYLRNDLPFLYAGGKREHNWLGCYGKTKKLPGAGTKNEGTIVNYVMPGSTGWISGLRENDVIVSVNDKTLLSLDDLQTELMKIDCNSIVKIGLEKEDGSVDIVFVYLQARPDNPGYMIYSYDIIRDAMYPLAGMKLVSSSAGDKKMYSIVQILKGSIADEYGFEIGDPIRLNKIEINKDCDQIYIEFYGKRRKNGYLDVGIGINSSLDSPYYF